MGRVKLPHSTLVTSQASPQRMESEHRLKYRITRADDRPVQDYCTRAWFEGTVVCAVGMITTENGTRPGTQVSKELREKMMMMKKNIQSTLVHDCRTHIAWNLSIFSR